MKRVFAASLLALAVAMPAAAQRTTGEIIGKIVDESGSVLPGVTVTLRGAGVAGAPTVVTSETGTYRFPLLPPGTYSVEYTLTGFSTLKREEIPVAVGSTVELNVSMKVGALEESITGLGRVAGRQRRLVRGQHDLQPPVGRECAGQAILVLRPGQLRAGRQRDVQRRTGHRGAVAGQQHERELVPDRRHRHQLDALAVHRRGGGSRSAPARGVGGVRQRPGRGLQHRHADGRQPVPRRCATSTCRPTG